MTNVNADGSVETPTVEGLLEQLKKAEAKIVDLKKTPETKPDEKEEDKVSLEKTISDLLDAKLAKVSTETKKEDEHINNQNISNSMIIDDDKRVNTTWTTISLKEFDNMTPSQWAEYMRNNTDEKWNVIFNI